MKTEQERFELFVLMSKRKLKKKDAASHVGVSCALISNYFNNKTNISLENERKLVEFIESAN